jgi:glycosyltransferase involved in cell wall biosynthesis
MDAKIDRTGESKGRLTIVIPALNEEEGITRTIERVPITEIRRTGYETQVLVVDNGSTDHTAKRASEAGADVVSEPVRGYGKALKTGFSAASGDIIVTADADATYPLEAIPSLLDVFNRDGLDFLTTNRFADLDKGTMSALNMVGNTILAMATRVLFRLDMRDPESGMWMFKKDVLNTLKLHSDSWPLSHEIKIEACYYARCRWKEVPVRYGTRVGKTKLVNNWRVGFIDLLHIAKKRVVR